jgi:hypothetical protein
MKMKDIKSARLAPYRRALERVGAALAKNARSDISEAEKTRYFMETLFGPNPYEKKPEDQNGASEE